MRKDYLRFRGNRRLNPSVNSGRGVSVSYGFYKQLAFLLKAGLPIYAALKMLEPKMAEEISGGKSFYEVLKAYGARPDIVSLIEVGEKNACLEDNLFDVAQHLEGQAKTRKRIKRTLTYPCIVLASSLVCVIALLVFILPMFESMFSGFDLPLPFLTRVLLAVSRYWWLVAVMLLAFPVLLALLYKKEQIKLRTPFIGRLHRFFVCERFCRLLAQQLKNGVPILEAVKNIKPGISLQTYRDSIDSIYQGLENGSSLTNCLTVKLYPETLVQMIRVGEETGTLDSVLFEAADYYRHEAESSIKNITGFIEPLSTLAVGGIVGLVAFAMLGPLFSMLDILQ